MRKLLHFALLLMISLLAKAQTLTLAPGTVVRTAPKPAGINLRDITGYDAGQIYKNLLCADNCGFEAAQLRQMWAQDHTTTTSTFQTTDGYGQIPLNIVVGATYKIVESTTASKGCTGTITSSTTGNGLNDGNAPTYTLGTPCAAALIAGDQLQLTQVQFPTPQSLWEASTGGGPNNGIWGGVSGGGKLTTDTATPYDGLQSLVLDQSAGGSASVSLYYDDNTTNVWINHNGTYQKCVAARLMSGTGTLTFTIQRNVGGGFNTSSTITPTGTWANYCSNATLSETGSLVGSVQASFSVTGTAKIEIDDASFMKTSGQDPTNTSVLRDEVISTLKTICGSHTTGARCPIRYWGSQNGESLDSTATGGDNWIRTQFAANPSSSGRANFGPRTKPLRLQDYLEAVRIVHGFPYFEEPITFSEQEAVNLIEFLYSTNTASGYGQKRAALGHSAPWCGATGEFGSDCYITFANEAWNSASFVGQNLPFRTGITPSQYADYGQRTGSIYAATRTSGSFSAAYTHLGFDAQADSFFGVSSAITAMAGRSGAPDFIEYGLYTQNTISNWQTAAAMFGSGLEQSYGDAVDPSSGSGYYQSITQGQAITNCGQAGNVACATTVYEYGNNTLATCGVNGNPACTGGANQAIIQTALDQETAGGAQGIIAANQYLLELEKHGMEVQNLWNLNEYSAGTLSGSTASQAKLWGCTIDMGGALSFMDSASQRFRPQCLALSIVNSAMIGDMFQCSLTSGPTYNWAGDAVNGPTHALNNVPSLFSNCFKDGSGNRTIAFVNTDLTTSRTVTLAGTDLPTGTVNVKRFTPPSATSLNEAPTGSTTNTTAATMSNVTSTLTAPTTVTVPALTVMSLTWATTAVPSCDITANMPVYGFQTIPGSERQINVKETNCQSGAISTIAVASNVLTVTGTGFDNFVAGRSAIISGYSFPYDFLNNVALTILTASPTGYTATVRHSDFSTASPVGGTAIQPTLIDWSVATTTGTVTASLGCTSACLPTVLVTMGATAGTCSAGAASPSGSYVMTSTQIVTVTATSHDDPSKTATFPIRQCGKSTRVEVSGAHYYQAFQGQLTHLQANVFGDTNQATTWAITAQPGGGNGVLDFSTFRNTIFHATGTGRYTITATSVSDGTKTDSVIIYVAPQAIPSYAAAPPNKAEPRPCYADPAIANVLEIGPTQAHTTLASVMTTATSLGANTIVRFHNEDVTGLAPTEYPEWAQFSNDGTSTQPILICGVPDSLGNLPIIEASNAHGPSWATTVGGPGYGQFTTLAVPTSSCYGLYQTGTCSPSFISFTGLHFRNSTATGITAWSITSNIVTFQLANRFRVGDVAGLGGFATSTFFNGQNVTVTSVSSTQFTAAFTHANGSATENGAAAFTLIMPDGVTRSNWGSGSDAINIRVGLNISAIGDEFDNTAQGVGTYDNGNGLWRSVSRSVLMSNNYFVNNGVANDSSSHPVYFQSYGGVIQFNLIGIPAAGDQGSCIKARGVGQILTGNRCEVGYARDIDWVEVQDSPMYVTFEEYLGPVGDTSCSFAYCLGDAAGMDVIAGYQESLYEDFGYGNAMNNNVPGNPLHYIGDHDNNAGAWGMNARYGHLYFWSNTMTQTAQGFDTSNQGTENYFLNPRFYLANNIFWNATTQFAINAWSTFIGDFHTNLYLTGSIVNTTPIYGSHYNFGDSFGWVKDWSTGSFYFSSPLNTHITGNLVTDFLVTPAQPFNTTTLAAQGAALSAVSTVTGPAAQFKVAMNAVSLAGAVTPRLRPQDLGAVDGAGAIIVGSTLTGKSRVTGNARIQ